MWFPLKTEYRIVKTTYDINQIAKGAFLHVELLVSNVPESSKLELWLFPYGVEKDPHPRFRSKAPKRTPKPRSRILVSHDFKLTNKDYGKKFVPVVGFENDGNSGQIIDIPGKGDARKIGRRP